MNGEIFLWLVQERWGELCGSDEIASHWADEFLPLLRAAWTDPRPGSYVRETGMCLSSLLAAGLHEELLDVLALQCYPFWSDRKFEVQALLAQGRIEEALVADARNLSKFEDQSYDLILALGLFVHILVEDVPTVFAEFWRVCRCGGVVMVTNSTKHFIDVYLDAAFGYGFELFIEKEGDCQASTTGRRYLLGFAKPITPPAEGI